MSTAPLFRCRLIQGLLFTFLIAFCHPALAVPETPILHPVQTYDELLKAIRETRAASQARIEAAVEAEKVREAWETGKLIDEHVLQHKERADYGEQVVIKLAKDLGASDTELKYMLQFARTYPIRPTSDELSWSHYRELLSLNDSKVREEVTQQAARERWSVVQVREEVRRRQQKQAPQSEKLEAQPGKVGTYRVVTAKAGEFKGKLVLDLGFSNYYKPGKKLKFRDRDIVVLEKEKLKKAGAEKDLFTYPAFVYQVIDGDTFYAVVSLGFGFNTVQKLRLRGLDAPEIESAEGKEAKAFLEKLLLTSPAPSLIKTSKSDKYDRYLADVWVGEKYVNQELLDQDLAVRVNE